jgi:addiction module RelB/DinJ family antitoxin
VAIVEMKSEFDALYEQFGMSANTAFNVFIKAVARSRSIPFTIIGTPNALDLFNQQREASEAIKGQKLSL